jgi:hypothetical protein
MKPGPSQGVVDWLCVTFGTTWPEHVVVVSFMACMTQPQMRDMLVKEPRRHGGPHSNPLIGNARRRPLPCRPGGRAIGRTHGGGTCRN